MIDPRDGSPKYDTAICSGLADIGWKTYLMTKSWNNDNWAETRRNFEVKTVFTIKRKIYKIMAMFAGTKFNSLIRIVCFLIGVKTSLKVISTLSKEAAIIIHFQWIFHTSYDRIFWLLIKKLGFPIFFTAHEFFPEDPTKAQKEAMFWFYKNADRIFVHDDKNKEELLALCEIDESKIQVVPFVSYNPFYKYKGISKEKARLFLNLKETDEIILFFGIIRKNKGLENLLEAFASFNAKRPNSKLLVAGKCNISVETIYSIIEKFSIKESVYLHLRYVEQNHVAFYFNAADVTVLPYLNSRQSAVLHTAIANGCPVIATEVGGIPTVVKDGFSGLLVPPNDIYQLTNALERFFTMTSTERESLSSQAFQWVECNVNWINVAHITSKFYKDIIEPYNKNKSKKEITSEEYSSTNVKYK